MLNDLEFQLTLQMKIDPPKPSTSYSVQSSPTAKSTKSQKASAFSRVFASPRKRKELELRQQIESQQQRAEEKALAERLSPWDKLRTLVANDGSFARAYVSLQDYENQSFGRPLSVDVTCFNEWASDTGSTGMKNSKKGSGYPAGSGAAHLPPYKIGNLELQLLYVPKPKGTKDDDMPKSMNACIREMREADSTASRCWEGFLSQQGGDCPVCLQLCH